MNRAFHSLSACICLLTFPGCGCHDDPEQKFKLRFFSSGEEEHPKLYSVYGLGGKNNIYRTYDGNYFLPMSMLADSSTYVIQTNINQTDTLTINYTREFTFKGESCGMGINYQNLNIGKSTTFDNVEINGNRYEIKIYR